MTKRLIAIVLTVATVGGAQGSLIYAAAFPVSGPPPHAAADDGGGGAAGQRASLAFASSVLPDAAGSAIECLRGGDSCFDLGSWDCCAEFFVLMAVGSATGAWMAAGLAAWAYWYYCLEYEQ